MNVTTAVIMTGGLTAAGQWAEGKDVGIRLVIGAGAFAIGLSLINEGSPDLAGKIGLLVMIVAMFRYIPPLAKKTGLIGGKK